MDWHKVGDLYGRPGTLVSMGIGDADSGVVGQMSVFGLVGETCLLYFFLPLFLPVFLLFLLGVTFFCVKRVFSARE